jgi:hypothetical protein
VCDTRIVILVLVVLHHPLFPSAAYLCSWFVVVVFFLYLLYKQIYHTCAVDKKADQGHKKGHAPRALHGAFIDRHLQTSHKGAKNTHLL